MISFCGALCQFLIAYWIHSTCILAGLAVVLHLFSRENSAVRDFAWRIGVVLGVITAAISLLMPARDPVMSATKGQSADSIESKILHSQSLRATDVTDDPSLRNHSLAQHQQPVSENELINSNAASTLEGSRKGSLEGVDGFNQNSGTQASHSNQFRRIVPASEQAPLIHTTLQCGTAIVALTYWSLALIYTGVQGYCIGVHLRKRGANCSRLKGLFEKIQTNRVSRQSPTCLVAEANQPFVYGWVRPIVVLPKAALEQLSDAQLQALLAHECGHVANRHTRWITLLTLVCRLFAFQPLNFWARNQWREAAELVADEWAVRSGISSMELAKCLTRVAEYQNANPAAWSLSAAAPSGRHLMKRVQRLLASSHTTKSKRQLPYHPVVLGSFLMLALCLLLATPGLATAQADRSVSAMQIAAEQLDDELRLLNEELQKLGQLQLSNASGEQSHNLKRLVDRRNQLLSRWNTIKNLIATELRS